MIAASRMYFSAVGAVVRRDLLVSASYRTRFLTRTLSGFFSLTLFYYISRMVHVSTFPSPDKYYAYAVVGLVILQVLNSTLDLPSATVRQELVAGTFERLVASPLGPAASVAGMMVFPFLYALVQGIVMLMFAAVVFGVELNWPAAALAIPAAFLGGLTFATLGAMIAGIVLVAKQVMGGTTFIVAGIALIGGLYFPAKLLPDWIEWTSYVQPFTPAIDLLRHLLVGTPLGHSAWLDVAKLVLWCLALVPLSLWVLAQGVAVGRRRGTIIEY